MAALSALAWASFNCDSSASTRSFSFCWSAGCGAAAAGRVARRTITAMLATKRRTWLGTFLGIGHLCDAVVPERCPDSYFRLGLYPSQRCPLFGGARSVLSGAQRGERRERLTIRWCGRAPGSLSDRDDRFVWAGLLGLEVPHHRRRDRYSRAATSLLTAAIEGEFFVHIVGSLLLGRAWVPPVRD